MSVDSVTAQLVVQIFAIVFFACAVGMAIYLLLANKKDNRPPDALPGAERAQQERSLPEPPVAPAPKFSFENVGVANPEEVAPDALPPASRGLPLPSRRALRERNAEKVAESTSIFAPGDDVENWQ